MRLGYASTVIVLAAVAGCSGASTYDDSAATESTDEATACVSTRATNSQHVTAGRAYTKPVTSVFGSTRTGYFAKGTDESLGTSRLTRTTLYEIAPGVFSKDSKKCPTSGGTGGASGSGGSSASGGTASSGGSSAGGAPGTGGTPTSGGVTGTGGTPASGGVTGTGGATGSGGSVSTVGEPRIPAAPASCPVLQTGNVTVLGQSVQLWVGPKQANKKGSVMFYWHGTGSSSSEAGLLGPALNEIQSEGGIVASFTTSLGTGQTTGNNVWFTDDFQMADAILACAVQQLNIDTHRIYTAGCSAGGLQAGSMAFFRSSYLAASMPNSGGIVSAFVRGFEDPSHIPSIITGHGGTNDQVGISFADTSVAACTAVDNAGGIAVDCDHGGGHCQAPAALVAAQWQFLKDHPFGVQSDPYTGGLPSNFPTYCRQF